MATSRPAWWNTRRPAGFRLSAVDCVVIAVSAPATWLLWQWLGEAALILPAVVLHFFLFCNVFRVRRNLELLWAVVFVANALVWILLGKFSIPRLILAQLPVTLIVILTTIFGRNYRGIGSRLREESDNAANSAVNPPRRTP